MAAIGGDLIASGRLGFESKLAHQPSNFVDTDRVSLVVQFFHDPSGTVFTAMLFKNDLYPSFQGGFGRIVFRSPVDAFKVLIKTAPVDPHHLAQYGDRIGLHLLPDKAESHFDSLAKKAAAFFKISRSISRRLFSLRKRLSSVCSCSRVRPSADTLSD